MSISLSISLYNAFYNAFSDFTNESVRVNGRKNILMQPEFNDADKIRDIISKFEDKEIVNNIKEENVKKISLDDLLLVSLIFCLYKKLKVFFCYNKFIRRVFLLF